MSLDLGYSSESSKTAQSQDGYPSGSLQSVSVDEDGYFNSRVILDKRDSTGGVQTGIAPGQLDAMSLRTG